MGFDAADFDGVGQQVLVTPKGLDRGFLQREEQGGPAGQRIESFLRAKERRALVFREPTLQEPSVVLQQMPETIAGFRVATDARQVARRCTHRSSRRGTRQPSGSTCSSTGSPSGATITGRQPRLSGPTARTR